jgi:hypothetical protein
MATSCQVGWLATILRTLTFHTFNSLATMTIKSLGVGIPESLEHKINPINQSINQSNNQIHSHYPSHSHQLHISQSNIAPSPNVHWMKHSGEAFQHPAILAIGTQRNPHQSINQSINQIHSHYPSHSHQLHISQSNIAPRPNAYSVMPSGEKCGNAATLTISHSRLVRIFGIQRMCINQSIKFTHNIYCIHIHSTFLNQISHHIQMSIG